MPSGTRDWRLQSLSILFAALPLAFGLIRAIKTGHDFRYVWVALASVVGAAIVSVAGGRSVAVFVVATLSAMIVAAALGTTANAGMAVVTASVGFCFAAPFLLRPWALDRPEPAPA